MRFCPSMKSRVEAVFSKKMAALAFDDERPVATWTQYLEGIGCRRVHFKRYFGLPRPRPPRGYIIIEDPIWHGDQILVPRDLAEKVIVLEWLP